MLDDYNTKSDPKNRLLDFEVDLDAYLTPEDFVLPINKMHGIIAKIADNDPTVTAGLEGLINETLPLPAFERALTLLVTARTERQLQMVEAALQVTINDVKNHHAQNPLLMPTQKCALYLNALQFLITNLGRWNLRDNKKHNFQPAILQKLQNVSERSLSLGLDDTIVNAQCYSTAYQDPEHPVLQDFKLLDEDRLNKFHKNLQHYESIKNINRASSDAAKNQQLLQQLVTNQNYAEFLDRVVNHLKITLKVENIDADFVTQNQQAVSQGICLYIDSNNKQIIDQTMDDLVRHLNRRERNQAPSTPERDR